MNRSQLKATLIIMVAFTICFAGLAWAIAAISYRAPKPPQTCNGSGIYKIIPSTDANDLTIVCKDGKTYYP